MQLTPQQSRLFTATTIGTSTNASGTTNSVHITYMSNVNMNYHPFANITTWRWYSLYNNLASHQHSVLNPRRPPQKSPTLQYPLHHQNISLTLCLPKSSSSRNSCTSSRLISTSRSRPCTSDVRRPCKKCRVFPGVQGPRHEQINVHDHLIP